MLPYINYVIFPNRSVRNDPFLPPFSLRTKTRPKSFLTLHAKAKSFGRSRKSKIIPYPPRKTRPVAWTEARSVQRSASKRLAMPILDPRSLRVSAIFLAGGLFLSCYPGLVLSAVVTLDSIEIYNTHELLKAVKPDVYFACKGENRTDLPDVKKANESYKFRGQESWQPLTDLSEKKCKRCGFYEKGVLLVDVFDEWEFCLSDFTSDGKYIRFKEKEVNATFFCPQCIPFANVSKSTSDSQKGGNRVHVAQIILISIVVSTVLILGLLAAYEYWPKKKREQKRRHDIERIIYTTTKKY
ncbi:hypothetical protein PanWU01x14_062720 [Parasponia andersonii]|uniref:DUF7953 domain-containing protein n=1 Tax=Parasponia andersonii TaxID=3476 RepID=A0A2P5DHS3_PARAD|nr:hypothetical protein PanWU01x14_062720 [Parasponia andersonii]